MEQQALIEGSNPTTEASCGINLPLDGGAALHEVFEAQVARLPNAVALTCEGRSMTYRQLDAQANRLARQLVQHGIKAEALVGLCLERSNELVIALLAILKAGGAYLPIDLAYPAERLAFMLEDAQAPVLLTQRKLVTSLPPTHAKVVCVDEVLARPPQAEEESALPSVVGPDHLAYVIYTSGTTGKPKGSMITHRNVVRLFSATQSWFQFDERDVWTLFHSIAFDFSVWEILGALLFGGRVVVVPFMVSRSPEAFCELLAREKVTVLNQTPSAFRQLIAADESGGQELALRYVIFGGEALEMQGLRPWFERHGDQQPRLVNMYGITETTVHVTYRPLTKEDLRSGSVIGVPIPDLQMHLLDERQQPVPEGGEGEIYVGGAGLGRGYLNRPELTAQKFVPDPFSQRPGARLYRSGDLARYLPNGDLEYLGRIDFQVKIRGFRVELGEIESVLNQHPSVRDSVVMVREDVPGDKRLTAYVIKRPGADARLADLRQALRNRLPEYMVPGAFVFVERFPLTANGKLDRNALPAPDPAAAAEPHGAFVSPATRLEQDIVGVWQEVLHATQVSLDDNFFDLGGNSLHLAQIHSCLQNLLNREFPITDLFEHATVRALAAHFGNAAGADGATDGIQERARRQREALAARRFTRR